MKIEVFDERVCTLGEGPHYDERTGRAVWVDILAGRVLWRALAAPGASAGAPEDGAGAFGTGAHVGAAVPTTGGGLVLCLPDRLVLRDAAGVSRTLAAYPASPGPAVRSNDAKADPAGRLWHGTMAYDLTPGVATLYRLDPGGRVPRPVVTGLTISNGLGWSPDGTTMYLVDTPTGRVDAFDHDPDTGALDRRRPFALVEAGAGLPDGLCVDAAGGVWVALWDGGAVRRYTPDGTLERTVELPTPLVTSCAFAGPGLDALLVTTAADGRPDDPAAGRTYLYRPGDVTGLPAARYDDTGHDGGDAGPRG